jgi:hypothetical protein
VREELACTSVANLPPFELPNYNGGYYRERNHRPPPAWRSRLQETNAHSDNAEWEVYSPRNLSRARANRASSRRRHARSHSDVESDSEDELEENRAIERWFGIGLLTSPLFTREREASEPARQTEITLGNAILAQTNDNQPMQAQAHQERSEQARRDGVLAGARESYWPSFSPLRDHRIPPLFRPESVPQGSSSHVEDVGTVALPESAVRANPDNPNPESEQVGTVEVIRDRQHPHPLWENEEGIVDVREVDSGDEADDEPSSDSSAPDLVTDTNTLQGLPSM